MRRRSTGASARRPLRVPPPLSPRHTAHPSHSRSFVLLARLVNQSDGLRLLLALLLITSGAVAAMSAAWADLALNRGEESGVGSDTAPHTIGRDLAINVDLSLFDPLALDDVAVSLQRNGFRYVRQSFSWAELEPDPGVYRWEEASAIIDALTRHQIVPVAVLHRSPDWARAPDQIGVFDAPPVDVAAYERFVRAFATTFGDRVPYLQLWDLPNRGDRWGNLPVDPVAYTLLLGAGFRGAREGAPAVTIVLAELDPHLSSDAPITDLDYLAGIYAAGGAPLFDVAAARVDGGTSSPFAVSAASGSSFLGRVVFFREAMIAAGDRQTPIWATHYGWAVDAGVGIDATRQAEFTIAGIERARAEWPWLGPLFAWGLRPGGTLSGEVPPEFALLGQNNESTPLLNAYAASASRGLTDTAPTGFLSVAARQIQFSEGDWEEQNLGPDAYRTTDEVGASLSVPFDGTGVTARLRLGPAAGQVEVQLDGRPVALQLDSFRAQDQDVAIAEGLPAGRHMLTLRLVGEGELTVGGLLVEREVPLRWPIALLLGSGIALAFVGFRQMVSVVAERTGRLQRRRGIDLWPELPGIPDWRPTRRT